MINFQVAKMNTVQMYTNFKGNESSKVENTEEKKIDAIDNPMETVGRSQVNFKSSKQLVKFLSAEELNVIAEYASRQKLTPKEVKVGKQALINTINEYGCLSVDELAYKINKSFDNIRKGKPAILGEKMLGSLERNIMEIDSSVDVDRTCSILDEFLFYRN